MIMVLGSLFLYLKAKPQLLDVMYSQVKVGSDGAIDRLKASWLLRDTLRFMALIREILPHQLPRWLLSVFSSLMQQ